MVQGVQASGMRLRLPMVGIVTALPLIAFALVMIVFVNGQQQRAMEDMLRQAASASVRNVDERILAVRVLCRCWALRWKKQAMRRSRHRRIAPCASVRTGWHSKCAIVMGRQEPTCRMGPCRTVRRSRLGRQPGRCRVPVWGTARRRHHRRRKSGRKRPGACSARQHPGVRRRGVSHILTAYVRAWVINRALRDQGLAPDWILAIIDDNQRLLARTLSDESKDPLLGTPPDPSVIAGLRGGNPSFSPRPCRVSVSTRRRPCRLQPVGRSCSEHPPPRSSRRRIGPSSPSWLAEQ